MFLLMIQIHIEDAELDEVANDDPPWAPRIGQGVGITESLFERRKEFAVGLTSGLIEIDAATFLFDEHFGRGNPSVDEASMVVDIDGDFKLNEIGRAVDAEHFNQVEPKGLSVGLFGAARLPIVDENFHVLTVNQMYHLGRNYITNDSRRL